MSQRRQILRQIVNNPNIRKNIKSVDDFINSYNKVINNQSLDTDLEREIDYRLNKQQQNRLWTIFLRCQKTKTAQVINKIKQLINNNEKSLSIIMCQNDSSLTLQTSERLHNVLPNQCKVFVLSSAINTKPAINDDSIVYNPEFKVLISYILKYILGSVGYLYPVIVSLTNDVQLTKIVSILELLQKPIINGGYHLFIDEADVTYPNLRDKLLKYIMTDDNTPNNKNYGTYWITATGINLIKGGASYNECRKAHQVDIMLSPDIDKVYFDITDEKAIIHKTKGDISGLLLYLLDRNENHFKQQFDDGSYRKIIAVAPNMTDEQNTLSLQIVSRGYNVITINSNGIILRTDVNTSRKLSFTKDIKEMNKLIAFKYNEIPGMKLKPLIILGNRKIDRGVTFHYPTNDDKRLIFTDIIIPRIINWRRAIQIAGRCAGIIKNDTFNGINFWIEENTYERIIKYIKYTDKRLEVPIGYKTIEELLK
jgi:hypothetical protein